MVYFIGGSSTETGINLYNKLNERYPIHKIQEHEVSRLHFHPQDVLIRYGSRFYPELDQYCHHIVNPVSFISWSRKKDQLLQTMEAHRIQCSHILTHEELRHPRFPLLGRRRIHSRARDIQIIRNTQDLRRARRCHYFVQYIPNHQEYRLHIINGDLVRIQKKFLPHQQSPGEVIIRNYDTGWRFEDLSRESFRHNISKLKQLVLFSKSIHSVVTKYNTSSKHTMKMYAVDVVENSHGLHFLETNAGPYLSPNGIRNYVRQISFFIEQAMTDESE